MSVYPSWRYHKKLGEKIVKNAKEDKALGPGWVSSPALVNEPVPSVPTIPVEPKGAV